MNAMKVVSYACAAGEAVCRVFLWPESVGKNLGYRQMFGVALWGAALGVISGILGIAGTKSESDLSVAALVALAVIVLAQLVFLLETYLEERWVTNHQIDESGMNWLNWCVSQLPQFIALGIVLIIGLGK